MTMKQTLSVSVAAALLLVTSVSIVKLYTENQVSPIEHQSQQILSMGEGREKDKALIEFLQQTQDQNQQHLQQVLSSQKQILATVNSMQQRLDQVESKVDAVPSHQTELHAGSEASDSNGVAVAENNATNITEAEFGQWMEDSIEFDYQDPEATQWAKAQALDSLANAPGVALDDMRCGDGFCRAAFSPMEQGKTAEISGLFGHPPFVNEGFSVLQNDGRVLLYFSEEGVSMEDLRSQAKQKYQYN